MPPSLKSLVIYATLASCILLPPGCTDSADHIEAWELKDEIPNTPFLPGVYEAEFEIINDGCEPSLHDIFDKVEGWPPPLTFIYQMESDENYNWLLFDIFSWRDGQLHTIGAHTDKNFVLYSEELGGEEWPSLLAFNYLECSINFRYASSYLGRAEVSLSAPNTLEVLITNNWGDFDVCVSEQAREVYKTIPRADCSESYKTTYRLVEACILPCKPPLLGLTGGTMDGYPYLRYEEPPPSCLCD